MPCRAERKRSTKLPWPALALPIALIATGPHPDPPLEPEAIRAAQGAARAVAESGMVTDRPDFTESASTVERGKYQLELGYTASGRGDGTEHVLGETLLRIGAGSRAEIRIGLGSVVVRSSARGSDTGVDDASLGVKLGLGRGSRAGGILGAEVALVLATSLPTGSGPAGRSGAVPLALLAAAWELDGPWQVGANFGVEYDVDGGSRFVTPRASISLARSLGDRWGAFVEAYTLAPGGGRRDVLMVDSGVTRALHADLQLDARVGTDVAGADQGTFFGLGLSTRW